MTNCCNAVFHWDCLNVWYKSKKTCPFCRKNIDIQSIYLCYDNHVELNKLFLTANTDQNNRNNSVFNIFDNDWNVLYFPDETDFLVLDDINNNTNNNNTNNNNTNNNNFNFRNNWSFYIGFIFGFVIFMIGLFIFFRFLLRKIISLTKNICSPKIAEWMMTIIYL